MAFIDNVGKMLTQTGQGAMQKTKDMAETVRISSAISEEEKRITELTRQLGMEICAAFDEISGEELLFWLNKRDRENTVSQSPSDGITGILLKGYGLDRVAEIKACREKITEYQNQMHTLRGMKACPGCGSMIPADSAFCSCCGYRIPEQQENPPAASFCPRCGAQTGKGNAFCTQCGYKL